MQSKRSSRLQWLAQMAAVLIAIAAPASGQLGDDKTNAASATSNSLRYRISATLTESCAVDRLLPLHEVIFDFHNASCQSRSRVYELKTPTLPNGPHYRNVRLAGYHFIDWSKGHSSPSTHNTAKVELSKTATTLSASGWLGPASCSKGASGDAPAENTSWQARVVPEVQFVEDIEDQQPAATVDIVPPETTAVLAFSVSCAGGKTESLQYTVTPIVGGVAQASVYTSPVLKAGQAEIDSDGTFDAASIHSRWNSQLPDGKTELGLTIIQSAGAAGQE